MEQLHCYKSNQKKGFEYCTGAPYLHYRFQLLLHIIFVINIDEHRFCNSKSQFKLISFIIYPMNNESITYIIYVG